MKHSKMNSPKKTPINAPGSKCHALVSRLIEFLYWNINSSVSHYLNAFNRASSIAALYVLVVYTLMYRSEPYTRTKNVIKK